jgi:hypothetical protein
MRQHILSAKSKWLYRTIADDYGLDREPHALELLRMACEQIDRADQAAPADRPRRRLPALRLVRTCVL